MDLFKNPLGFSTLARKGLSISYIKFPSIHFCTSVSQFSPLLVWVSHTILLLCTTILLMAHLYHMYFDVLDVVHVTLLKWETYGSFSLQLGCRLRLWRSHLHLKSKRERYSCLGFEWQNFCVSMKFGAFEIHPRSLGKVFLISYIPFMYSFVSINY